MSNDMQVTPNQTTATASGTPSQPSNRQAPTIQQPTETAEKSAIPDAETLEQTVTDINDVMAQFQRTLNFSIDHDAGKTIIKVIDTSNDELIRQIPSEDFIEISKHIEQMNNLLFSEKV